ncbi:MAG: o-succinylbenzoate synthase [Gemmatimonadaceae bacterium]|nr:o-succinylbenzoate synthase [Gemmatimonadaceae bacterium]
MLQITGITLREIRLPLREPFRISSGTMTDRRIALLELHDASGASAWSECVADDLPNYTSETIDTAWLAISRWIAPRVIGRRFNAPGDVFAVLEEDFRGHLMAKAAVEMGMWGVESVRIGTPLARLIGGTRAAIPVGISLGIQASPEALVGKVRAALDEGYRKIKLKIMPGKDVAYVRAVREAFPDAPLMADANNAYTLDDAEALVAMDAMNLMMFEQPLAWEDIVRHGQLQRMLKTPVCLDESITSLARAQDMVTLGAGRLINIKPGRVGGFAESLAIHDFCEANGIPVWCGGMLESGIGRAYNVALASLSNFQKPGDLSPSARYWARDIVTPEWTMDAEGMVQVPRTSPGIGVQVDVDRIDDLTVRTESL